MLTRWGETLDKQQVLQEYPRPQLVRESFYNLNGLWDYAITASDACPGRSAFPTPDSGASGEKGTRICPSHAPGQASEAVMA